MPDPAVPVVVRRARAEEAPALLALIRALARYEKLEPPGEDATERLVRDIFGPRPRMDAFLAFVGGVAVGYALVLETYSSFLAMPTLYLEDIFVAPEYRSRRVGSAVFKRMVEEARSRGCGRMEWVVLDWNKPAQDFYAKFGAGHLRDWYTYRLTRDDFDRILDKQ